MHAASWKESTKKRRLGSRSCLLWCRLLGSGLLCCGLGSGSLLGCTPLLWCSLGGSGLRGLGLGDTAGLCLPENTCDLLLNSRGGASGGSSGRLAGLAGVRLRLSSSGLLLGGGLLGSSLCGCGLLGGGSLLGGGGGLCLLTDVSN